MIAASIGPHSTSEATTVAILSPPAARRIAAPAARAAIWSRKPWRPGFRGFGSWFPRRPLAGGRGLPASLICRRVPRGHRADVFAGGPRHGVVNARQPGCRSRHAAGCAASTRYCVSLPASLNPDCLHLLASSKLRAPCRTLNACRTSAVVTAFFGNKKEKRRENRNIGGIVDRRCCVLVHLRYRPPLMIQRSAQPSPAGINDSTQVGCGDPGHLALAHQGGARMASPFSPPPGISSFREVVRRFVEKEIEPYALEWDKAGGFPRGCSTKKAAEIGLLGLNFPEEQYGGIPKLDNSRVDRGGPGTGAGRCRRRQRESEEQFDRRAADPRAATLRQNSRRGCCRDSVGPEEFGAGHHRTQRPAPTSPICAPRRAATAIAMSSAARRPCSPRGCAPITSRRRCAPAGRSYNWRLACW